MRQLRPAEGTLPGIIQWIFALAASFMLRPFLRPLRLPKVDVAACPYKAHYDPVLRVEPIELTEVNDVKLEVIIAAAALGVSVFALGATGYQAFLQYDHNRVSVTPKLDWRKYYNYADFSFELRLVNRGLGPAIVRNLEVTIDGENFTTDNMLACGKLDHFLGLNEFEHEQNACWIMSLDEELYLKVDEEIVVYRVGRRSDTGTEGVGTQTAHLIGLSADYCSLYNQCFKLE